MCSGMPVMSYRPHTVPEGSSEEVMMHATRNLIGHRVIAWTEERSGRGECAGEDDHGTVVADWGLRVVRVLWDSDGTITLYKVADLINEMPKVEEIA